MNALSKSPLGEFVTYAKKEWAELTIDNKGVERAVKPFAIGVHTSQAKKKRGSGNSSGNRT